MVAGSASTTRVAIAAVATDSTLGAHAHWTIIIRNALNILWVAHGLLRRSARRGGAVLRSLVMSHRSLLRGTAVHAAWAHRRLHERDRTCLDNLLLLCRADGRAIGWAFRESLSALLILHYIKCLHGCGINWLWVSYDNWLRLMRCARRLCAWLSRPMWDVTAPAGVTRGRRIWYRSLLGSATARAGRQMAAIACGELGEVAAKAIGQTAAITFLLWFLNWYDDGVRAIRSNFVAIGMSDTFRAAIKIVKLITNFLLDEFGREILESPCWVHFTCVSSD